MTNSGTPDEGNGIAAAAAAFEQILAGKPATQGAEDTDAEDPANDEAEALQASTDEDETPSDEEGAEDEEAAANDEDADEAEEQEGERLITVKIDGEVMQIPESEAAKGYQRQADYSRHMQALREERNEVQAERAQYAQLLTALQQQLAEAAPREPDWERLYAEDPLEYVRQRENWRDQQEKLAAVQAENQRLAYLQQQEQAQNLQAKVQQGREELFQYNPAWRDKATWETERVRLREYGVKQGYSEQEISQAYDPRAVRLLHKAMKFDELMARKPQPLRPEGPKAAKGGPSQAMPSRKHSDLAKAKMRLAKTGSVRDAAKVFEGLI